MDGDGVVTREELYTMLSHIPSAFKILDASMGWQPGASSGFSGSVGVDSQDRGYESGESGTVACVH